MAKTDGTELLKQIDQLERVQGEIAAIAKRTDEGRLRELVQLRRKLADQMGKVGALGEEYFRGIADQAQLGQFRALFSNMRSRTATHQANWPAINLEQAGGGYRQSAQAVNEAIQEFIAWARPKLS